MGYGMGFKSKKHLQVLGAVLQCISGKKRNEICEHVCDVKLKSMMIFWGITASNRTWERGAFVDV